MRAVLINPEACVALLTTPSRRAVCARARHGINDTVVRTHFVGTGALVAKGASPGVGTILAHA